MFIFKPTICCEFCFEQLFDFGEKIVSRVIVNKMSDADGSSGSDFARGQCLLVHNLPKTFSEIDSRQLLQLFDPISIEFLVPHRAVYAKFSSQQHARDVLAVLHQQILDGKRLYVEYAEGNARDVTSILKRSGFVNDIRDGINGETATAEAAFGNVMRKLYATADNLNFNQPPPPHLRYNYPLVNRDIIDSISIALETSRKFYVQVLHLMNRMNLEPPFVPGDKKLKYEPQIDEQPNVQRTISENASTQTEEIIWQHFIRKKRKRVASDESELETTTTDDEEVTKMTRSQPKIANDQIAVRSKQKQRRVLKMQRIQMKANGEKRQTIDTHSSISVAFDSPPPVAKAIKIIAPKQFQPILVTNEMPVETDLVDPSEPPAIEASNAIWTDAQIQENRIPDDQLRTHPLFQNYVPGAITNRLYIKNIAKEVTEEDLKAIYHRYLEENSNGVGNVRSIDIRLMQTGRMKGQAFVTFTGPYLDSDDDVDDSRKYQIITKALSETNGLIVKSKVLVVTYGKKK